MGFALGGIFFLEFGFEVFPVDGELLLRNEFLDPRGDVEGVKKVGQEDAIEEA